MASTDASLFSCDISDSKKEKSPTALRTISEASEVLGVPQHVLRFWETKFTQIKPLKRNGGRRFYRPQDLDILQQIKHLLYSQGYTIKGAKKAVDAFIHARAENNVSASEWMAAIPPASVNDNFVPAEPEDMLAEIAQALAEPEVQAQVEAAVIASPLPREKLLAMREELMQSRAALQALVPALAA
ncbi:MAG: MerR family transcriptional regulator [Alphaproteobacteria bacterium]|nr:MerR family transcriptional regulator [Alphaproteobacteria bacterium]